MKDRFANSILIEDIFDGDVKFMEPMSNHTSLRIGGPADAFAVPRDIPSLERMQGYLRENSLPFFPVGGGTNILVRDGGIEGFVVSFRSFGRIETVEEDDDHVSLRVGAGTALQRLVNLSREKGYSGLEGLAGIPGTVGGAICGNAGAFGYEMKDFLVSVEIMDAEGKIGTVNAKGISFGYRCSGISQSQLLLRAEIKLGRDSREDVSERIDYFLRSKRANQPLCEHSAGCVFKNPPGLSAGRLIDESGCKGMRIGDAEVSSVHANFFVNKGNAKSADFISLMDEVAARVKKKFDIALEREIRIIGRGSVD